MKKSNLKKLNLKKAVVSNVTSAQIKGGLPTTLQSTVRPTVKYSNLIKTCNCR